MSKQVGESIPFGSHGQGALRKFDDSPNWVYCYHQGGKERRESSRTPDLKAARRFAKARLDEIAADRQGLKPFIVPTARQVTIADLLDEWEADVELRGLKSARKLIYHEKPIRAYFGTMKAVDVRADKIDTYVAAQVRIGKANATINRGVQILGSALKLACRRGKLPAMPMIRKLSEANNARRIFWTPEQYEKALKACPEYLQDALRFSHLLGWRKGEVVSLRWGMVNTAEGTLTLPDSKNSKPRTVAIVGELKEIIGRREAARLVETPDGRVNLADHIFHRQGAPLGDFKRAWETARVEAGLAARVMDPSKKCGTRLVSEVTFHDLRRTAVRNLDRSGVRRDVAKSITGHKTDLMYSRYNITSQDDIREALEAVSKRG
jgi:integrase